MQDTDKIMHIGYITWFNLLYRYTYYGSILTVGSLGWILWIGSIQFLQVDTSNGMSEVHFYIQWYQRFTPYLHYVVIVWHTYCIFIRVL